MKFLKLIVWYIVFGKDGVRKMKDDVKRDLHESVRKDIRKNVIEDKPGYIKRFFTWLIGAIALLWS